MLQSGLNPLYPFPSLASYLDKKFIVLLEDGRKFLGVLCSFDEHGDIVLQGACERVIFGDLYCDIRLGLYVIRGESIALIGELADKEEKNLVTLKRTIKSMVDSLEMDGN